MFRKSNVLKRKQWGSLSSFFVALMWRTAALDVTRSKPLKRATGNLDPAKPSKTSLCFNCFTSLMNKVVKHRLGLVILCPLQNWTADEYTHLQCGSWYFKERNIFVKELLWWRLGCFKVGYTRYHGFCTIPKHEQPWFVYVQTRLLLVSNLVFGGYQKGKRQTWNCKSQTPIPSHFISTDLS